MSPYRTIAKRPPFPEESYKDCPCWKYVHGLTLFQHLDDYPEYFTGNSVQYGKPGYSALHRFVNMQHTRICIEARRKDCEENHGDSKKRKLTVPVFCGSDFSDGEWWAWKGEKRAFKISMKLAAVSVATIVAHVIVTWLRSRGVL